MNRFEDSVLKTIRSHRLLDRGQTVVVAVSGGPDSVALLLTLVQLRHELDIVIQAAHVNHLLRGAESEGDERFVWELCESLQVPLHVRRLETSQGAENSRQNLEDYARRLRYGFLFEVAAEHKAVVATGHTLNDLSETFLLKLFRGAGLSGLSGIYPCRRNELEGGVVVNVVRPLLYCSRSEVLDYLAQKEVSFRQDSSNRDLTFDRNLLRHELIPFIEKRLNPEVLRILGRTASLFRELEDYLSPVLDKAYQACREPEEAPALKTKGLLSQHPFVQKEIVRRALKELRGDLKDVSARQVEDILRLATGQSGSECHLGGGIRVRREFDRLRFGAEKRIPQFEYKLTIPGDVYIKEARKRIVVRKASRAKADQVNSKALSRRVVLSFQDCCLGVRNRRAGDRYRVGKRYRKLKEILIEKKIPRSRRDELLVLHDGEKIIWVEGLPPNPDFQVAPQTPVIEIEIQDETFAR